MAKVKNPDALDLLQADFEHVGRHRARRTPKDRWFEFLWLALASVLLSSAGYFGLQYAVAALAHPAPTQKIIKGIDYSVPITVIDGSGTRLYASRVGQLLLDYQIDRANRGLVVPYSRTLDMTLPNSSIQIQKEEYRRLADKIQGVVGPLPIVLKADGKYAIEVRLGLGYAPVE